MLMQLMQMDPRFMDVLQELTGIDLNAMGKDARQNEERTEAMRKEAEAKRKAEEDAAAAKRKAEEEAKLP